MHEYKDNLGGSLFFIAILQNNIRSPPHAYNLTIYGIWGLLNRPGMSSVLWSQP